MVAIEAGRLLRVGEEEGSEATGDTSVLASEIVVVSF